MGYKDMVMDRESVMFGIIIGLITFGVISVYDHYELYVDHTQLELEYGYAMELLDYCMYEPTQAKDLKRDLPISTERFQWT